MSTLRSIASNVGIFRTERAALDAHLDAIFADWQTKRAFAVAAFEARWPEGNRFVEFEEARDSLPRPNMSSRN